MPTLVSSSMMDKINSRTEIRNLAHGQSHRHPVESHDLSEYLPEEALQYRYRSAKFMHGRMPICRVSGSFLPHSLKSVPRINPNFNGSSSPFHRENENKEDETIEKQHPFSDDKTMTRPVLNKSTREESVLSESLEKYEDQSVPITNVEPPSPLAPPYQESIQRTTSSTQV